ncbi:MAG: hypothetical protein U5K37_06450 [Natrialbaceae archaeon]|nr:hypothetical protein [Natrialbaceae archaeon]
MSLTSFVKRESVRDRFDEKFPNKGNRAENDICVEWQSNQYRLVGTAFDYLVRFWLRRHATDIQSRPWVAEASLEIAHEEYPGIVEDLTNRIDRAKEARDTYLESGESTESLLEASLDLARIDGIYRGGDPPVDLGEYDSNALSDCRELLEILDETNVLTGDEVDLNPAFGVGSALVGGADADVILDGTLIDIKTSSKATFKIDYWRQLVGYLLLADIHADLNQWQFYEQLGIGEDPNCRAYQDIDSFGVYFARHGELSTVSSDIVYDHPGYMDVRSWFIEEAIDAYEPMDHAFREELRTILLEE